MDSILVAGGIVVALLLIGRYATRKVKTAKRPRAALVVGVAGGRAGDNAWGTSGGDGSAGPGLGTFIAVQVLGLIGLGGAVYAFSLDHALARVAVAFFSIFFFNWLAMKVVESTEGRGGFSLSGHLIGIVCAISILLWIVLTLCCVGDIAPWVLGVLGA